jgi:hypothetical protein
LPLANRFVHLQWGASSVEEWTAWLTNCEGDSSPIPILDRKEWDRQFLLSKVLVAAFLRRRPGLLSEDPAKVSGRFPLAYATPRTWEAATRLLATCRASGSDESVLTLFTGTLGEPIAVEFCAWLRENDLPDPEELLRNPEKFKPDVRYPDRVFATCLAVASVVIGDGKKKPKLERYNAAWKVLDKAIPIGKDIVAIAARKLAAESVRPEAALLQPEIRKIITQLKDVVFSAGIS